MTDQLRKESPAPLLTPEYETRTRCECYWPPFWRSLILTTTTAAQDATPSADAMAERTGILFDIGTEALAEADEADSDDERRRLHDRAIAAFRRILVDRPDLVRVRLELARAFFLRGRAGLARRHFEAALAGGVPPPVAASIYRFLAIMQAPRTPTSMSHPKASSSTSTPRSGACPSRPRGILAPSPASACRCGAAASTGSGSRETGGSSCGSAVTRPCGSIRAAISTSFFWRRMSDRSGSSVRAPN